MNDQQKPTIDVARRRASVRGDIAMTAVVVSDAKDEATASDVVLIDEVYRQTEILTEIRDLLKARQPLSVSFKVPAQGEQDRCGYAEQVTRTAEALGLIDEPVKAEDGTVLPDPEPSPFQRSVLVGGERVVLSGDAEAVHMLVSLAEKAAKS